MNCGADNTTQQFTLHQLYLHDIVRMQVQFGPFIGVVYNIGAQCLYSRERQLTTVEKKYRLFCRGERSRCDHGKVGRGDKITATWVEVSKFAGRK